MGSLQSLSQPPERYSAHPSPRLKGPGGGASPCPWRRRCQLRRGSYIGPITSYKSLLEIRRRAARRDLIFMSTLFFVGWMAGLLFGTTGESRGLFMALWLLLPIGLGLGRALWRMNLSDQLLELMEWLADRR